MRSSNRWRWTVEGVAVEFSCVVLLIRLPRRPLASEPAVALCVTLAVEGLKYSEVHASSRLVKRDGSPDGGLRSQLPMMPASPPTIARRTGPGGSVRAAPHGRQRGATC